MVMNIGNHVNILKEKNFKKVSPSQFCERVRAAYLAGDATEFYVFVAYKDGDGLKRLPCKFTAPTLVQLTNQFWVREITQRSVATLC